MPVTPELAAFVKDALARNLPRPGIEAVLRRAGWRPDQIEAALAAYAQVEYPLPVPRPRPYVYPREAFLYLLLFATLYATSFNLGRLVFTLIELALPDPTAPPREIILLSDTIRWSVASLIVAFPIFLFVSRVVSRHLANGVLKRASGLRKSLIYLTLFVSACALLGDGTTLVYNLLSAETTLRFALKVVTIAVIAGTIFAYYLLELAQDERGRPG